MSLVCAQCSRVNPAEAAYCYYDGAALAGRAGGPINAGAANFPNPFVFPNGLSCRNFDQLAMACQQNWSAAIDLLKQGFLGSFFGGIGRVDLSAAAQEAAKFPDLDRGLDQLIAKLPSQAVQAPKLKAEPTEINLGIVKIGEDRSTELHLANAGMRLLYGTATSDCKWLTLGEAPGNPDKLFQFGADAVIPVQVRGQHLRAGNKPIEGHLVLDSNGGTITVTFRADVPIKPYDGGLFAGATTPRQVAEKAKAGAKEAAPYFEKGEVAKWYAANGWVYPVQGPTMPGPGGIQQFFEALGVAKAPKVEFSPTTLVLDGAVGKPVEGSIEITTAERKVVYGWATADAPWIEIGKTKITGKTARIPITFRIPNPAPPVLEATIHVTGNGNQKTDLPVKIKVAGGKTGVKVAGPEEFVALEIIDDEKPLEIIEEPSTPVKPAPQPLPANKPLPVEMVEEDSPFSVIDAPAPTAKSTPSSTSGGPPAKVLPLPIRLFMHLVPVAVLAFFLLILIAMDIFSKAPPPKELGGPNITEIDESEVDKNALVKLEFDEGRRDKFYNDTMNWAVHKFDSKDPKAEKIKLNYYDNGSGNNVMVKIDTRDYVFGEPPANGQWFKDKKEDHTKGGVDAGKYGGKRRTFEFNNNIRVTQTVTIEPSDLIEVKPGEFKRLLGTALVRYKIENKDKNTHKVAMRILMDTYINNRDDVPFLLPGVDEPVKDKKRLVGPEVPGFVQVIEKESVRDPGIVLHLGLRISDKIDPPDEFMLTRYPNYGFKKWVVPYEDFTKVGEPEGDSSVVLIWNAKDVPAGKSREIGFTYGLGTISAESDRLGMTVGGPFLAKTDLTVVALVSDTKAKEVTLKLPPGMSTKDKLTQPVPPIIRGRASPITWRVYTPDAGSKQEISISTDNGLSLKRRVTIGAKPLFN